MRRRWVVATVVAIALLLLGGRAIAGWYVEYRWYEALGAAAVWQVRAWNLFLLRGATFVVGALFIFANLYAVRGSVRSLVLPRRVANVEIGEEVPGRYLVGGALAISLVISGLLALPHDDWLSLELVRHGESFRETDPYFNFDIAFWLYWLPLETSLHLWALLALLAATLVVVFLYALTPSLRWDSGRLHVSGYVRRHLFALGAILLVVLAWSYRLDAYALLNDGSGPMGAFTEVDHEIGIPVNLVLAVLTVAAALLVAWSGWINQVRVAFFTVTAVLVAALALRQVVPPVAQRIVAPGDPDQRDRPYLVTRAGYTRRAYDVDRLTREDTGGSAALRPDLRGASLWDEGALARTTTRATRGARANATLGWEVVEGRPLVLVVTPPSGTEAADPLAPWGITRYAADVAGERGAPIERVIAEGDVADAGAARAVLVFDSVASYVVLSDSLRRIAGANLTTLGSRIAHAWHLQNPRLLGSVVPPGARIVLRRGVRERLAAVYPFFEQGDRLWPVAWRDSLYWAVHLHAASEWYPLSDQMRFGGKDVRFLRHAAVALVNAHTGRLTAVPTSQPDPVTRSWVQRFPMLFTPESAFDDDLLRRLPPAIDAVVIQAQAFAQVGVRGEFLPPSHLPRRWGGDTTFTLDRTAPFVDPLSQRLTIALPVLDAADRLRGVITVTGGAGYDPHWRPLPATGPRWTYVLDRLQRIPDSLNAAPPRDAHLLRGPVRVMPRDAGADFVQTTYAARPDGIVQVLHVAVLSGDSLGVGTTIPSAIGAPSPPASLGPLTAEEFRAQVEAFYLEMRDALRRGDLRAFGAAYDGLGRLLRTSER